MLTADRSLVTATTRSVRIQVSSVVVRLALMHVAESVGWRSCSHEIGCTCLVLTDRCPADGANHVLVVQDTPAACMDALDHVIGGRARSVVLWNEPETLATVFDAIHHRSTIVPDRVIVLATHAPRLTLRQRDTLRLVGLGRSNQAIAVVLHQSLSTVKREIADLLLLFDVPNRAALMVAATTLGFIGRRAGSAAVGEAGGHQRLAGRR